MILNFLHKNKSIKVRLKAKTMHIKKMQDAQMHEDIASNACRVLQRLKKLDQEPKE